MLIETNTNSIEFYPILFYSHWISQVTLENMKTFELNIFIKLCTIVCVIKCDTKKLDMLWWSQRVKLIYSRHVFVQWTTTYHNHINYSKSQFLFSSPFNVHFLSTFIYSSFNDHFIYYYYSVWMPFQQAKSAHKRFHRFKVVFLFAIRWMCNMQQCVFRIQYFVEFMALRFWLSPS